MPTALIAALLTTSSPRPVILFWSNAGAGVAQVWVMNEKGGGRRITQGDTPTWTPNVRIVYDVPDGIWTVRPDGSERRKLISGDVGEAAWSPDGRRIAYTSWQHGPPEIYVANADGGAARRLTHNAVDDFGARWSPDGRRILYTHGADGSRQVYVMNADGSGKTNLSRNSFDEWATDWR
jgi:Tol biopolymer transport system component